MRRSTSRPLTVRLAAVAVAGAALAANLLAADASPHDVVHARKAADRSMAHAVSADGAAADGVVTGVACVDGEAAGFPCHNVDLQAFLPLAAIGGTDLNDIWGWTDPETGHEYALVGKRSGMAIVDVTVPTAPRYLGDVATETANSTWRDIKVHDDIAYIVSEAPAHGVQRFDLTQLRGVTDPQEWEADSTALLTGAVHNFVVNQDSGIGYAVGSDLCRGGPIAIDLARFQPLSVDGCAFGDAYTHDAQCLTYDGPDQDHVGQEICLALNEDSLTIYDLSVSLPGLPLAKVEYPQAEYTHQGWLTDDRNYLLVGDELDETRLGVPTTTLVFDVRDLDAPELVGRYEHDTDAIDHNLYVTGNQVHQANYRAGYRLLELTDLSKAQLTELAYFDVYPFDDHAAFNGAWGVYPFFSSGTVIVSGIEQGLFVLRPTVEWDVQPQRSPGGSWPVGLPIG